MTSDQFCLKWNNYQANIVVALGNLKLDEDFVDVTLACDGKTIKAHRVVLSACSSYFKQQNISGIDSPLSSSLKPYRVY